MKFFKEIGRNPTLDWLIILSVLVLGILAFTLGGVYLYNAVNNGQITHDPVAVSDSFQRFNPKVITSLTDSLSQRESVSRAARGVYKGAPDPAPARKSVK